LFCLLGSTSALNGMRKTFDPFFILSSILVLFSQLIYYWNHKTGVEPTFLRLFQVMSGSLPPNAIGLTDQTLITTLCRRTNLWFRLIRLNNDKFILFCAFFYTMAPYVVKTNMFYTLMYGIPNALLFVIWGHYYWNVFAFQFIVFLILCTYLESKINRFNENVAEIVKTKGFQGMPKMIRSFHSISDEISEYNNTYWSKYLLIYWLTFGLSVTLIIICVFFTSINIVSKIIMTYCAIMLTFSFLLLLFKASSVNYSTKKSYKLFNSLFISYSKHNKNRRPKRTFDMFKVMNKLKYSNNFNKIQFRLSVLYVAYL
jgi:hypothetical protein